MGIQMEQKKLTKTILMISTCKTKYSTLRVKHFLTYDKSGKKIQIIRDDHLNQSEAYDTSQLVREYRLRITGLLLIVIQTKPTVCVISWACILVQVVTYRRLRIGRDGHLNQSEVATATHNF